LLPTHRVINDVMLTLMGLICRTPENGIERRTPSKIKYQNKYRYIHESGSNHTQNNKNTRSCQPALERKIITLGLKKIVNSST
jgi:hypothetical protein